MNKELALAITNRKNRIIFAIANDGGIYNLGKLIGRNKEAARSVISANKILEKLGKPNETTERK